MTILSVVKRNLETSMTISKDTLKKMRVINQVDSKFILAKEGNIL